MKERSIWVRQRTARSPYLFDATLGVVGAVVAGVAFLDAEPTARYPTEPGVAGLVLVAVAWLALVWRRRSPAATFAVSSAAWIALALTGAPDAAAALAPPVALYAVAAYSGRAAVVVAFVASTLTNVGVLVATDDLMASSIAWTLAIDVAIVAAGDRRRVRAAYLEQLELRAAERERERIEAARRAVGAERVRIARELHDVVAHAMSVVAVQSGVGAHVIDKDPAAAKQLLETISETSRDALGEMRRLLGVLRAEAGEGPGGDDRAGGPELAPAPGLAGLDELAERVTAAGVPVTLVVTGDHTGLAAGVDLAAYRIVQEALTNVLKHAGRARAKVEVRCGADEVRLVIADDGRGLAPGTTAPPGSGHGIVGMRERAELYGGRLAVGPRPGGGFQVVAVLHRTAPASAA